MTRHGASLDRDYFETLYGRDPDPWRFASSPYERDKYEATLQALLRPHYGAALEVGCSIGVFTRRLAERCEHLLALDISEAALAQARTRCADRPSVAFRRAALPAEFPAGAYDLIVLSEVLYYLVPDDLETLAERCLASLAPGGEIVLCHWLGETDYPLTGDEAAERFIAATAARLTVSSRRREPDYRLDVLRG